VKYRYIRVQIRFGLVAEKGKTVSTFRLHLIPICIRYKNTNIMTQLAILLRFAQLIAASGFLSRPQHLVRPATVENSSLWAKQNKKNEGFDMKELKELKRRINEVRNPYNELFPVDWNVQPDNVHIIVFNPNTAQQGIHSIQQATGNQFVLAF
jgi:Protein of unknown function (DUF3110)